MVADRETSGCQCASSKEDVILDMSSCRHTPVAMVWLLVI